MIKWTLGYYHSSRGTVNQLFPCILEPAFFLVHGLLATSEKSEYSQFPLMQTINHSHLHDAFDALYSASGMCISLLFHGLFKTTLVFKLAIKNCPCSYE